MTSLIDRPPARERWRSGDPVRRAWCSLLLLPVSFFGAFALGEVLYSATGHDPSNQTPPHWADAVALISAGIVFAIPAVFALVYARGAVRSGRRAGYAPATVAIVILLGYGVLSML